MLIEFQKTEHGVTIHLPEELADASVFEAGNLVDVSRENGHLVVRQPGIGTNAVPPARRSKYSTAELLKGVTDENIHGEIDWGPPVGKEVW